MSKNLEHTDISKIENYTFQEFEDVERSSEVRDYSFDDFTEVRERVKKESQPIIRIEREHAKKNLFQISEVVQKHRGIKEQEEKDFEEKVENEVVRRLELLKEEAYKEGFETGKEKGFDEASKELEKSTLEKMARLEEIIDDVHAFRDKIFSKEKEDIYKLIRTLAKWVVQREVNDDKSYLSRLLERLILELQTRNNLLVRVDEGSFAHMADVLEVVKTRIGALSNVRVEIDHDIKGRGMVLESGKGILYGTLKAQFENIDSLFETVIVSEEGTESSAATMSEYEDNPVLVTDEAPEFIETDSDEGDEDGE